MSGTIECDSGVYISEEILVQILKRLPAKSLARFISVCKSWYSLIRNPEFISTHFNYQTALNKINLEPKYLLYLDLRNIDKYYVHCDNARFDRHLWLTFPGGFRVVRVGYCDGVVCLGHSSRPYVVLWNPSIRKTLDLNVPHEVGIDETFSHGFGFDAQKKDYKVVSIAYSTTKLGGVYVYSQNLGLWRRLNATFVLDGGSMIPFKGVHVGGVIHWLVDRSQRSGKSRFYILTFDLADETFSEISLPGDMVDDPWHGYAMLMTYPSWDNEHERLAILRVLYGSYSLWVMEADRLMVSWRVMLSQNSFAGYGVRRFVHARRSGEIMVEVEDGRLFSIYLSHMSCSNVANESLDYVGTYVESLVLL